MHIEINSRNFHDNHNAKSLIKEIITNAVDEFLGNEIIIDKFVVTDEDNHGHEIEKIQIQYGIATGYTNSGGNIAVAKVITNSDKQISIVFLDYLFAAIIDGFLKSKNIEEWHHNAQLNYYIIFHELAHCYDDQKRKQIYNTQQFKRSSFSRLQIKEHYICTILSEFAACALSNQRLTETAFLNEVKRTIDESDSHLLALENCKNQYFDGNVEIVDIAYQVAQTIWFILTQWSKIIGSTLSLERKFSIKQITELPQSKICITPALLELDNLLKQLWDKYPVWVSESVEPLNLIFENMAADVGFIFNGNDEHSLIVKKLK